MKTQNLQRTIYEIKEENYLSTQKDNGKKSENKTLVVMIMEMKKN